MKKWLISFLLLTSLFFGMNKIFAYSESYIFDYDLWYNQLSQDEINLVNNIINYNSTNFPNAKYIIIKHPSSGISVYYYKDDVENIGNWYFISNKGARNYSGTIGIMSGTPVNKKIIRVAKDNTIRIFGNLTNENFVDVLSTFDNTYYATNFNPTSSIPSSSSSVVNYSSILYLYSSFSINTSYYLVNGTVDNGYAPITIKYNGEEEIINNGDNINFLFNYINSNVVVNLVKDLGNNTYGFYQNVVGINATSLSGAVDTLSIICEENKPFENGFCSMNYNDLINHNSDINVFNNYATEFTQLFGNNTGYLYNDKYYLYSFRIQKPFVPQVGNIFINSLTNNSNQVNILNVYANDGGSYTDYVVKFKIENSNYDSSTNLKDILVVFRDGLGTYYNNFIPNTFNYSVYRSFKLQYFDSEPTMTNVNDFYNNNDLTYIDGVSSQNSFFTDNEFNSFGFGGIITAPFRFLYALENYESCSDINVPFPHSNQNLTLTCVRKNIPTSLNPLIVILQVILSGVISYRIAVGTLKIIKDVSSPEDSNIEVVDL